MIRIIGIIHVLDLTMKIHSIIDFYMPSAVAIELDYKRLNALINKERNSKITLTGLLSRIQMKIASKYHVIPGSEMLAAYNKANMNGIPVFLIDDDIDRIYDDIGRIPFGEKSKLVLNAIFSVIFSRKTSIYEIIENEDIYMEKFRKSFPNLYEILITKRNKLMAERIKEIEGKYGDVMVFTGDAHVKDLGKLLPGSQMIRLKEFLRMDLPNTSFNFTIRIS